MFERGKKFIDAIQRGRASLDLAYVEDASAGVREFAMEQEKLQGDKHARLDIDSGGVAKYHHLVDQWYDAYQWCASHGLSEQVEKLEPPVSIVEVRDEPDEVVEQMIQEAEAQMKPIIDLLVGKLQEELLPYSKEKIGNLPTGIYFARNGIERHSKEPLSVTELIEYIDYVKQEQLLAEYKQAYDRVSQLVKMYECFAGQRLLFQEWPRDDSFRTFQSFIDDYYILRHSHTETAISQVQSYAREDFENSIAQFESLLQKKLSKVRRDLDIVNGYCQNIQPPAMPPTFCQDASKAQQALDHRDWPHVALEYNGFQLSLKLQASEHVQKIEALLAAGGTIPEEPFELFPPPPPEIHKPETDEPETSEVTYEKLPEGLRTMREVLLALKDELSEEKLKVYKEKYPEVIGALRSVVELVGKGFTEAFALNEGAVSEANSAATAKSLHRTEQEIAQGADDQEKKWKGTRKTVAIFTGHLLVKLQQLKFYNGFKDHLSDTSLYIDDHLAQHLDELAIRFRESAEDVCDARFPQIRLFESPKDSNTMDEIPSMNMSQLRSPVIEYLHYKSYIDHEETQKWLRSVASQPGSLEHHRAWLKKYQEGKPDDTVMDKFVVGNVIGMGWSDRSTDAVIEKSSVQTWERSYTLGDLRKALEDLAPEGEWGKLHGRVVDAWRAAMKKKFVGIDDSTLDDILKTDTSLMHTLADKTEESFQAKKRS